MDNFDRELQKRFSDMKVAPADDVWKNIEKRAPKSGNVYIKIFSIIGSVLILGAVALLYYTPQTKPETRSIIERGGNTENVAGQPQAESGNAASPVAETEKQMQDGTPFSAAEAETAAAVNNDETEPAVSEKTASAAPAVQPVKVNETKPVVTVSAAKETRNVTEKKKTVQSTKSSSQTENLTDKGNLFIPNAFTPTQSTNNVFLPAYRELNAYEMQIFSRNGSKVFSSKDITIGWDGTYKGQIMDKGVYVYYIKYTDSEGKEHTQSGKLMLLR